MIDDITIARALHVLAVVHWIGGVSFVTLIVLPLARCCGAAGIDLFERIEHGFSGRYAFPFRSPEQVASG